MQTGHADLSEATCHPRLIVDTGDSVRAHETTAAVVDAAAQYPDAESYVSCPA